MEASSRVIVNTVAQYTRTAINLVLSLYSTRVILVALGVDDYGIYTLIAGIISILSFVVNALVVTTQRYMSFYSSNSNIDKLKEIFNNSLLIHIAAGVIGAILIELIGLWLFDGYFNIAENRVHAAKMVYHFVTLMLLFSFVTSPYRALLISHENIVYISIIDVLDGILKVVIAVFLTHAQGEKLVIYAMLLAVLQVVNLLAFSVYDSLKYEECILPRISMFNKQYVKDISSFAGWTIYSIGCITGRTQGIAIIVNKFYDVAVNAAYGVALQVNGALMFLSQSLLNAMNPQIMKSEGSGDRQKMLRLSETESKLCFFLMAIFLIPMIVEMPAILELWLDEVPEHSIMFCRGMLLASLVDQLTVGLGTANQAIGKIKWYSIVVNSIKILTLVPIVLALIFWPEKMTLIMVIFVVFELICAIVRIPFLHYTAGLSVGGFVKNVILREMLPTLAIVAVSLTLGRFTEGPSGMFLNIAVSVLLGATFIYFLGLDKHERSYVAGFVRRVI